jgi:monooxygenase
MKTDFCVVGGGPGGLALALLLARSGAEVVVAERSRSLDRRYRGDILQPGGLAVLDQLGVLAGARARGAYELDNFALVERDRTLLDIDYRALPGRYNYLLSIPQPHVLAELLARCQELPNLTYLGGHRAVGLRGDGSTVTGVTVEGGAGPRDIDARVVIGADGRYSKIRSLAGIHHQRDRSLAFVVLWTKIALSNPGDTGSSVRIYRMEGDPVVVHPSWPTSVQFG